MSANTGIITSQNGAYQTSAVYYSPIASVATTGLPIGTFYCFLSRVNPWTSETIPPAPTQDQKYLKETFRNMFVARKITSNDMSPVIERINWVSGEVYDYYQDDINMFALDTNGTILRRFYIKNRFDQVFKCLWNNNDGVVSTEPYFEPGTFNANQIFQGADDYKWKYMYTITSGNKLKFMDDAWMPVPVATHIPNPYSTFAGRGSIDVINITNGGSGYDPSNAAITVTVTGDGENATGSATIVSGSVTDIVVANTGSNYSYANVVISTTIGSGAVAVAPTSPIGGHGYDSVTELGVRHVMMTARFTKDESGKIPTDIDFRQIGILVNPSAKFGTVYGRANADIYKTTTDFIVSQGFGAYTADEIVYQSTNGLLASATFTATVLSFDVSTNTLKLINTLGTANNSALIYGGTTATSRAVVSQQPPDFIPFSGYLTYLENREPVQRNIDGSEIFKLVLGY
jgi:hypothetical protein